ncbi:hypothetical protein ACQCP0_21570, partial [Ralstonia pseudosolanacearum]
TGSSNLALLVTPSDTSNGTLTERHYAIRRVFSFCICQVARKIEPTSGRRHNDIIPKMKKGLQALTCKPFHILVGRA